MFTWWRLFTVVGIVSLAMAAGSIVLWGGTRADGASIPDGVAPGRPDPKPEYLDIVAWVEANGGWDEEPPEWVAPVKLGRYKGYCDKDGNPVITEVPAVPKTAYSELKATCFDGRFINEIVIHYGPGRDATDLSLYPVPPADFKRRTAVKLNGSHLVDPWREKDVVAYFNTADQALVPAHWIVEALGGRVKWDENGNRLITMWRDRIVVLTVGSSVALINGESVDLPHPPQLVAGRVVIPIELLIPAWGAEIAWDDFSHVFHLEIEGATCPLSYCWDRRSAQN